MGAGCLKFVAWQNYPDAFSILNGVEFNLAYLGLIPFIKQHPIAWITALRYKCPLTFVLSNPIGHQGSP